MFLEWDKPCDNNEEIVLYNIYVSEDKTSEGMLYQTEAQAENPFGTYKVPDLEPNHIYYVKVRAINSKGEGYVPD